MAAEGVPLVPAPVRSPWWRAAPATPAQRIDHESVCKAVGREVCREPTVHGPFSAHFGPVEAVDEQIGRSKPDTG
jgi:hypothetical protein